MIAQSVVERLDVIDLALNTLVYSRWTCLVQLEFVDSARDGGIIVVGIIVPKDELIPFPRSGENDRSTGMRIFASDEWAAEVDRVASRVSSASQSILRVSYKVEI